jgi:hypothetical protein
MGLLGIWWDFLDWRSAHFNVSTYIRQETYRKRGSTRLPQVAFEYCDVHAVGLRGQVRKFTRCREA